MTVDFSAFFTRFGKAAALMDTVNAHLLDDAEADLEDMLDQLAGLPEVDQLAIGNGTDTGLATYRAAGPSALNTMVRRTMERLLIYTVKSDLQQPDDTLETALVEFIRQMKATGDSLDASTPSILTMYGEGPGSSSGPPAGNTGNGVFVTSVRRPDGLVNEHILAEMIDCDVTASQTNGQATWRLRGQPAASHELAYDWPGGSGCSKSVTSQVAAANNLVTNGGFETESTIAADMPDGWIGVTVTPGVTIGMSEIEVQTVVISGTPTGGHYYLIFTDKDAVDHWTTPLAYNANGATVQAALRVLPGMESITVVTTGTAPDYTHTITMTDVTNPAELTSDSMLTGGTPVITHATPTAGRQEVVRGAQSLKWTTDGAELTCIMQRVTLASLTQYACNVWCCNSRPPTTGQITVALIDGQNGSTITDDDGNYCSFSINVADLTGTMMPFNGVYRTPTTLPNATYLRIKMSVLIPALAEIYFDELCLVAMTEMYTGGFYVAAFSGSDNHAVGDDARLFVSNDRAGALHEKANLVYALREKRLLLPTNDAGAETIDDALIV